MINLGNETITLEPDERIAQIVCIKTEQLEFIEASELTNSARGTQGFGSTGTKRD